MDTPATSPRPMVTRSPAPTTSARSPRSDGSLLAPDADPDAVVKEILTDLGELRYRRAQRLAKEAAARFPDHPGARKMNRALNEWKARTRPATGRDTTEEDNWLKNPPESAYGKWVALIGSEMVGSAERLAELIEQLRSMNLPKSALVVRID